MDIIDLARNFAKEAHQGQKRRNGEDYFEGHVEPVAMIVSRSLAEYDFDLNPWCKGVIAAAYLHDVLEDTNASIEQFPKRVREIVQILTRKKSENYFDFILSIKNNEQLYPEAVRIKLADLHHNMSTLEEGSLKDKYRFARYILLIPPSTLQEN